MIFLLADVGGTNARLALARDGVIDRATISRFRGDDRAGGTLLSPLSFPGLHL